MELAAPKMYEEEEDPVRLTQAQVCRAFSRLKIEPKSIAEQGEIAQILALVFGPPDPFGEQPTVTFNEFCYLCQKIEDLLQFKYAESELRYCEQFFHRRRLSVFRKAFVGGTNAVASTRRDRMSLQDVRQFLMLQFKIRLVPEDLWRFLQEELPTGSSAIKNPPRTGDEYSSRIVHH